MMSTRQKKIIWCVAGVMTFVSVVVMYITHRKIPFMMDDLWYATLLYEETPLSSLGDVIKSQIWHYMNWGGRSMTHGLLQLILMAGELWADILNVGVTLLLAWAVCLVAEERRLPFFSAALGMVLGLNANWQMSMFWQAGAANYLYITVFILLFAFCYLRELSDSGARAGKETAGKTAVVETAVGETTVAETAGETVTGETKPLPGVTLWILPLGILAGWSNENMGPAVWILSLLVLLDCVRRKKRLAPWMILGNLACLLGSVVMILAPGNFARSGEVASSQYGLLWQIYLRIYAEGKASLEYLFPALLALGLVLLAGKCVLKIPLGRRNGLLLLTALLSWGAMVLSPHYPDRATFGTMVLLICVTLSMAAKILRQRQDLCWPFMGVSMLIWLRGMFFCGEYLGIVWGWIK